MPNRTIASDHQRRHHRAADETVRRCSRRAPAAPLHRVRVLMVTLGAGDEPQLAVGDHGFPGLEPASITVWPSSDSPTTTGRGCACHIRALPRTRKTPPVRSALPARAPELCPAARRGSGGVDELARPQRCRRGWRTVPLSSIVPVLASTVLSTKLSSPRSEAALMLGLAGDHHGQLMTGHVRRTSAGRCSGIEKVDVDRLDLVDHDASWCRIVGLDEISGMNQQIAGAAIDGRANCGVAEVELRRLFTPP